MIEYENGTLRVSAGYSLKVPGSADYSSEDAHASLSLEAQVDGDDVKLSDVIEQAKLLYATLAQSAKIAVFAQLNVEFDTTDTGLLRPIIKGSAPAPKRTAPATNSQPKQQQQYAPPKADTSDLPIVTIDGVQYRDQRPLKADGTYKPGAADFKSVDKVNGRFAQLWLADKNGNQNAEVVAALERSGVSTFTAAEAEPFA